MRVVRVNSGVCVTCNNGKVRFLSGWNYEREMSCMNQIVNCIPKQDLDFERKIVLHELLVSVLCKQLLS